MSRTTSNKTASNTRKTDMKSPAFLLMAPVGIVAALFHFLLSDYPLVSWPFWVDTIVMVVLFSLALFVATREHFVLPLFLVIVILLATQASGGYAGKLLAEPTYPRHVDVFRENAPLIASDIIRDLELSGALDPVVSLVDPATEFSDSPEASSIEVAIYESLEYRLIAFYRRHPEIAVSREYMPIVIRAQIDWRELAPSRATLRVAADSFSGSYRWLGGSAFEAIYDRDDAGESSPVSTQPQER